MRYVFGGFLVVLLGLSVVAVWLKPGQVRSDRIVLSYSCVEFWAKREQVALFNRLNPKYEAQIDTGNTTMEKVIVQSLAGVGPDLFNAYAAFQASAFIQAGIAWDITEPMKAAGIDVRNVTWPATHSFTIRDGRVYGFPYAAHTDALFFNKDLFDRQGIPYPKGVLQRDEFLELARKLTVQDEKGRVRHFGFLLRWEHNWRDLIQQWGGRIYSPDGTRCEFDCPENVEAIQFMYDLTWKHGVSPSAEQESGMATVGGWGSGTPTWFGGGRAAMALGGRYWLVAFRQKDQYPGLRLGVVAYQFGPKPGHAGYAGCVMINRHSPRREHALAYLKYMAGEEYNQLVNHQADGLAPVKRFAYTDAFLRDPAYPEEDSNEVWKYVLEHSTPDEISPFINGSMEDRLINDQLSLLKNRNKSVEEALKTAARQINEEIRKNIDQDPKLRALYEKRRGGGDSGETSAAPADARR
jgi:multiple sugar transport system substrate-binding protein